MIKTYILTASFVYQNDRIIMEQDVERLLLTLEKAGWEPAILINNRNFFDKAGVDEHFLIRQSFLVNDVKVNPLFSVLGEKYFQNPLSLVGDIFFKSEGMYYLAVNSKSVDSLRSHPLFQRLPRGMRNNIHLSNLQLEIGLISKEIDRVEEYARAFAAVVGQAISDAWTVVSERYTWSIASSDISWQDLSENHVRIQKIMAEEDQQKGIFEQADFSEEEILAAQLLENRDVRNILADIAQVAQAEAKSDEAITEKFIAYVDDLPELLNEMRLKGLVDFTYQVQCRENGHLLASVQNTEQLAASDSTNSVCPYCQRALRDEEISLWYQATNFAKKMTSQGYWLIVLMMHILRELGIGKDSIVYNRSSEGRQVDLLVEFLSEVWTVIIRDREINMEDAAVVNSSYDNYQADRSCVLATHEISDEVMHAIYEGRKERNPVYVGSLDNFVPTLRLFLAGDYRTDFSFRLRDLMTYSRFNLLLLVGLLFRED